MPIFDFQDEKRKRKESTTDDTDIGGYDGGNGGGDEMLERVKNLEDKVTSLSIDIAVIKATMCTKEDLHKELNGQTWKIVIALIITVLIAILSKYFIK